IRIFKRETGVTPYHFLLQTRIRNSIEFLRDTAQPITGIAFDVGFSDLSNFINAFRREVGCSPREYRKSGAPIAPRLTNRKR
ncbi:MAG: helix-turn-helix transcriptional regulator, partial [Candidatus Binataceae bacterium]